MTAPPALARRLGLGDAVVIGMGSMLGAGVFAALAPAAAAAGSWLLLGLAIAAVVAVCNALASAQLAAQYPVSGGTYHFGRERLGEWPGFLAGWAFVIGKTASCAAMALTFAAYAVPAEWQRPVAVAAVLALAVVDRFGITRTARVTRVLVVVVLLVLAVVVAGGWLGGRGQDAEADAAPTGWYGVLQSAGLLFFAFAGYARIATLGEEVRHPRRTIPRAIGIALATVLVVYAVLAVTALTVLGPARLAGSTAPLADVATAGLPWAAPVVAVGAAAGSLGALLALLTGVGRTTLAMARNDDLPRALATVHPRHRTPSRAGLAIAAAVVVLVLVADLRQAIGFSSFGVLLYYALANAAAFTQHRPDRLVPRVLPVVGALGCLVLVATLPWTSIAAGAAVLLVGVAVRAVRLRIARARR